jgi:hypothetical protein
VQVELAGTLGWHVLVCVKFCPGTLPLMMFTLLIVSAVEPAF